MKQILSNIGNFMLNIVKVESDISSKRVCLLGFMLIVSVMWVIMSFKLGALASIDSGVVAIIVALSGTAAIDHFAAPKNAEPGACRGNGKTNGVNK